MGLSEIPRGFEILLNFIDFLELPVISTSTFQAVEQESSKPHPKFNIQFSTISYQIAPPLYFLYPNCHVATKNEEEKPNEKYDFPFGSVFFSSLLLTFIERKKKGKAWKKKKKISFMVVLHGKKWVEKNQYFLIYQVNVREFCVFSCFDTAQKKIFLYRNSNKNMCIKIYTATVEKKGKVNAAKIFC